MSCWLRNADARQRSVVLCALLVAGCRPDPAAHNGHNPGTDHAVPLVKFQGDYPIRVVCSTGPIHDMLRSVGDAHLKVTGLMGPGVDPHLYRAVPSDIEALEEADLIVFNGLHLEGRMADLFGRMAKRKPVVAVTAGLVAASDPRLLKPPEFEGQYDPHVWHDAGLWADCLTYVVDRLCEFDPQHAATYRSAGETYRGQIRALDDYCRTQIATLPSDRRALVTAHDAFGYFSRAYGLQPEALKGISTDDEVDIGRMEEIVQMLVAQRIPAVFVESAVAPKIVEALIEPCRARGHEVSIGGELYADALGPVGSGADSYAGMLRANVDAIVSALSAPSSE